MHLVEEESQHFLPNAPGSNAVQGLPPILFETYCRNFADIQRHFVHIYDYTFPILICWTAHTFVNLR